MTYIKKQIKTSNKPQPGEGFLCTSVFSQRECRGRDMIDEQTPQWHIGISPANSPGRLSSGVYNYFADTQCTLRYNSGLASQKSYRWKRSDHVRREKKCPESTLPCTTDVPRRMALRRPQRRCKSAFGSRQSNQPIGKGAASCQVMLTMYCAQGIEGGRGGVLRIMHAIVISRKHGERPPCQPWERLTVWHE